MYRYGMSLPPCAFVLVCCVVLSGCDLLGDQAPDPSFRIVYTVAEGGKIDLRMLDVERRQEQQLLSSSEFIVSPIWLAEGSHILYNTFDSLSTTYRLVVAQLEGAEVVSTKEIVRMDQPMGNPLVSPDGRTVVFMAGRSHSGKDIYSVKLDGSDLRRLTDNRGADIATSWSPDGNSILFQSADHDDGAYEERVYLMNADGSNRRPLFEGTFRSYAAQWSPDGSRILFVAGQEGDEKLYIVDPESGKEQSIMNIGGLYYGEWPQWSPDGKQIAFASTLTGQYRVYVAEADGSGIQILSQQEGLAPRWSPSGEQLAYRSYDGSTPVLHIVDLEGATRSVYAPAREMNALERTTSMQFAWSPVALTWK